MNIEQLQKLNETLDSEGRRFFDERYKFHTDKGVDPEKARDLASDDVIEASRPIEIPETEEDVELV